MSPKILLDLDVTSVICEEKESLLSIWTPKSFSHSTTCKQLWPDEDGIV